MDRILFADDEKNLRITVYDYLTAAGFAVSLAADGEAAVALAAENAFDLVILDVMMPRMNGMEACREIRRFSDVPVLFLSALGEEEDLLRGYGAGADDYITKPYSLPVLVKKCRAIIARRRGAGADGILTAGDLSLDPAKMTVDAGGTPIPLTAKECRLLTYLMQNRGIVLTREQILAEVWGFGYEGGSRVVDAFIKTLRKKLGRHGKAIGTVTGVGYVFRGEETK